MSNTKPVEVYIGESGVSLAARLTPTATVDRQPAGLNFHEIHWPFESMGSVIFKNGGKRFPIDHVLSFLGTEDMELKEEGLLEVSIGSSISDKEKILHDEAKLLTIAYLQRIMHQGWKPTIPRDAPRLRGKDMNNYLLTIDRYTTLDPNYMPTLTEWMQYEDGTTWEFYDNKVFLTVKITRDLSLVDPLKPGAYFMSTSAQNESEHFRGYLNGSRRARWKELLPSIIDAMNKTRKKKEASLREKGISIDETYVDPPLPKI